MHSRRQFVKGVSVAAASVLVGGRASAVAALQRGATPRRAVETQG